MGQRMSSDNATAHKAPLRKNHAAAGKEVYVLPQEEDLLGRCWLLAPSADSFSPSRWFALTPSTWRGARLADRRAFSVSKDVLPSNERVRQPVLRDLGVNVHKGLSVYGYQGITVASLKAQAAQQKKSLRVGGVQVSLPLLPPGDGGDSSGARGIGLYVIIAVRRVSVEADLREYATASFTRYPVKAPPANEEERNEYGEGCITGLLYGAAVVLHVPPASASGVGARIVRMCEVAAREAGVPPSALQVQEESVMGVGGSADASAHPDAAATDGAASPKCSSSVRLLSVNCADGFDAALKECLPGSLSDLLKDGMIDDDAWKGVAQWVVRVHQTPSAWCLLNAFLQRYEAIAESLLVAKRKA
jgi:hypothetical protein